MIVKHVNLVIMEMQQRTIIQNVSFVHVMKMEQNTIVITAMVNVLANLTWLVQIVIIVMMDILTLIVEM